MTHIVMNMASPPRHCCDADVLHSLIEQHCLFGCRAEGDQQGPGLQGSTVEAGTTGPGGGERSLSAGVGMHEDALQKGQHLDQVLGAGRKSNT